MKKIRAFYYKENYYCFLPGEDRTVEELRASRGGKGIQMNVTRLSRKNCLPPYFVTGQQETVTVRLKPWHMYPVTAYLLSREEYDARLLKLVKNTCPGCLHHGGDGTELEDHCYLEMDLAGNCPYRQEKSRYSLQAAAATAWRKLGKKNKELRALVDAAGKLGAAAVYGFCGPHGPGGLPAQLGCVQLPAQRSVPVPPGGAGPAQ